MNLLRQNVFSVDYQRFIVLLRQNKMSIIFA
nr:MAG TPA: hypothetical protein [Caudoviricetes sp.]